MRNHLSSLLALLLIITLFSAKSQDLQINNLIELKRGNIQQLTNSYIGKGWSIVSIENSEIERNPIPQEIKLVFSSEQSKSAESNLNITLRTNQTIYSVSWSFNSEDFYNKLLSSIKSVNMDRQWVELFETSGIHNHYEKDEIHFNLIVNTQGSYISDKKFTIILGSYFPEIFKVITDSSNIAHLKEGLRKSDSKSIEAYGKLIYYTELKIGGLVMEYDNKLDKDKTPLDGEYSIVGPNGISVIVENGVITSINQRKKTTRN